MVIYSRTLRVDLPAGQSAFLWGPRKTGKSTLLRQQFPDSARFDLLDTRLLLDFTRAPWRLAQRVRALDTAARERPILNPILITLPTRFALALALAEGAGVEDRLEVFDIEQFLVAHLITRSRFTTETRAAVVRRFASRYNEMVDRTGADRSLKIRVRGNP